MSAGSNNIIIQISDGIAPTIEPKIRGIQSAAIDANTSIATLTTSLSNLNVNNLNVLTNAANNVTPALNRATTGGNRLTNALAQLIGRAVGAEAGLGMMGGALSRVGVAAGVAGPLIVAGLAVGAVAAAVLIYENFEKAARELTKAQIDLANQFGKNNDKLLEQQETLTGLTNGPLAKYLAQLRDADFKTIDVNIGKINADLEKQKSIIATVVADTPRYLAFLASVVQGGGIGNSTLLIDPKVSIQEAQDYITNQEKIRAESGNSKQAIEKDLADVGQKLIDMHNLEATLSAADIAINEVGRRDIQNYYKELSQDYQSFLNQKKIDQQEANNALATEQMRQFNQEIANIKEHDGILTIQRELAIRQQQRSGDTTGRDTTGLPLAAKAPLTANQNANTKELNKDIGNLTQATLRQNAALDAAVEKYKANQEAIGQYSQASKIATAQKKEEENLEARFAGNAGLGAAKRAIDEAVESRIRDIESLKVEAQLYAQFDEPLIQYQSALNGIAKSYALGEVNASQAGASQAKATRSYQEATDYLFKYKEGLNDNTALIGKYGDALTIASQVQDVNNTLRAHGYTLSKQDTDGLTSYLTALQQQLNIQAEMNRLVAENTDLNKRNLETQIALNTAFHDHIISATQYKIATAQLNIAEAEHNLIVGKGATVQKQLVAAFGKTLQGYQGLAKGISDSYGQAFATIEDGAANSLGRAIVYAENLGDAMVNVARTALSELISGFIKLGLQWLINEAISRTLQTTATATSAASAAALGAAWAPVAAFVSLATFGANAAPAIAAITATVALSEGLNAVTGAIASATNAGSNVSGGAQGGGIGFASGGYVSGARGIDQIRAWLSHGEFVMNANATSQHRAALEAMNRGAAPVGQGLSIHVTHDGSTAVAVEQISRNEVRIIAKQEARQMVTTHAPNVIASDLQNPNSKTSKAVGNHLQAPRKR